MIDLEIVRQRMIAYLGDACGDDLYSTEREIGQHMVAICEGVIAGDLRPDAVMALQMLGWARARGLVEDD